MHHRLLALAEALEAAAAALGRSASWPDSFEPTSSDRGHEAHLPMLLTIEEVAEHLRIGPSSVYELLRKATIPSITIGGSRRGPSTVLLQWIAGGGHDRLPEC